MPPHVFIRGDARKLPLPDNSVHACVTSPPYYDLREYTSNDREIGRSERGGLAGYVLDMVGVFEEVRRVLRPDGSLILNLGDSYADKQLLGVPWLVASHMRHKGWILRSDSIWFKPNGMPDSARDRPEMQHEYCFHFTKSPRNYWDKYAVERPDRLSVRRVPVGRSKHKHFASYPPQLVLPYILQATSSAGVCPDCGAPWLRVVTKERVPTRPGRDNKIDETGKARRDSRRHVTHVSTLGWRPSCDCAGQPQVHSELELLSLRVPVAVPAVVLDPFSGACTTSLACEWTGRSSVAVDLGGDYLSLGRERVRTERPKRKKTKAGGWEPLPGQGVFPIFSQAV